MLSTTQKLVLLVACAVAFRVLVSVNRHSGQEKPPLHGDFEAQRHWMEVAVNLPASQWYSNSSVNDMAYWGLDYPPLAGYLAWALGQGFARVLPESVALMTSRGLETDAVKLGMRLTVYLVDLACFFSGALCFTRLFHRREPDRTQEVRALPVPQRAGVVAHITCGTALEGV